MIDIFDVLTAETPKELQEKWEKLMSPRGTVCAECGEDHIKEMKCSIKKVEQK